MSICILGLPNPLKGLKVKGNVKLQVPKQMQMKGHYSEQRVYMLQNVKVRSNQKKKKKKKP